MDKIMIFGVFEFVSFHLCKKFLEQGFNVNGIDIDSGGDGLLDEKRLEVGRNANFKEQAFEQWQEQRGNDQAPVTLIFPLYDWYMTFSEAVLEQETMAESIFQFMNSRKGLRDKVVFLLPVPFLVDSAVNPSLKRIGKFVGQVRNNMENYQSFYLPTLYGPWQPKTFLFQKTMLKRLGKMDQQMEVESREWANDAIFIDDVLEPLTEMIDSDQSGQYILESGVPECWKACVDFLKMDQHVSGEIGQRRMTVPEQAERVILPKLTPADEGLTIQWKHLSRLFGNNPE